MSKKGEIYQFVAIEDCAWANGLTSGIENATSELVLKRGKDENPNWYSVSIEHEGIWAETKGVLTPAQLEATKMLHKYIIEYVKVNFGHEIEPSRKTVIGHYEIDKKQKPNCPDSCSHSMKLLLSWQSLSRYKWTLGREFDKTGN